MSLELLSIVFLSIICQGSDLTITSDPPEVEIFNVKGQSLGKTPLALSDAAIFSAFKSNDVLNFTARKPGFEKREYSFIQTGNTQIKIKLTPYNEALFDAEFKKLGNQKFNELAKNLLIIQGNLIQKNIQDSEEKINRLLKEYPNLASLYVLKAQLEVMNGHTEKAKNFLLRARTLDPEDNVADRMYRNLAKTRN